METNNQTPVAESGTETHNISKRNLHNVQCIRLCCVFHFTSDVAFAKTSQYLRCLPVWLRWTSRSMNITIRPQHFLILPVLMCVVYIFVAISALAFLKSNGCSFIRWCARNYVGGIKPLVTFTWRLMVIRTGGFSI